MKKKESVGDILCQIEVLVHKLFDQHGFQWGDWLWNQFGWLKIHRPGDQEKYLEGGRSPHFSYGYRPTRKVMKRKVYKILKNWENHKMEPRAADEILNFIDREYK